MTTIEKKFVNMTGVRPEGLPYILESKPGTRVYRGKGPRLFGFGHYRACHDGMRVRGAIAKSGENALARVLDRLPR